jgi:phenylalanyl-tRNA synthetase beta chain
MKISENWFRTWVNPAIDSDTLSDQLTMLGLKLMSLHQPNLYWCGGW